MLISENDACSRYCGRLYHKARARGFNTDEFNARLNETFGVDMVSKLRYEDYKKALAMLNAIPLIPGHDAELPKRKKAKRK